VFTSLRRTFKLEVSEVTTELDKGRSLEGVCVCEGGGGVGGAGGGGGGGGGVEHLQSTGSRQIIESQSANCFRPIRLKFEEIDKKMNEKLDE
jgi:hypothetical protein